MGIGWSVDSRKVETRISHFAFVLSFCVFHFSFFILYSFFFLSLLSTHLAPPLEGRKGQRTRILMFLSYSKKRVKDTTTQSSWKKEKRNNLPFEHRVLCKASRLTYHVLLHSVERSVDHFIDYWLIPIREFSEICSREPSWNVS